MILVSFYSEALVADQIGKRKKKKKKKKKKNNICIQLHVQNSEIFCDHSYNILI